MIRNIIFDFGGVLLDVDFSKTRKAFMEIGYPHFDEMYTQFYSDPLFEKLETGHIETKDFLDQLQKKSKQPVTHQQLINAWNALLGEFRIGEIEYVNKLKEKYNIFLFSNTNEIHYEAFQKRYTDLTQKKFDDNFHCAYYSHILGKRKPTTESYEAVLFKHSLKAENTLFIDDSYNNIEGAVEAGLKTYLLLKGEKVSTVLPGILT